MLDASGCVHANLLTILDEAVSISRAVFHSNSQTNQIIKLKDPSFVFYFSLCIVGKC